MAMWSRAKEVIAEDPGRASQCRRLIRRVAACISLPWVVMGIGLTMGRVPTVLHFCRPRDGNPYVLAFHVALLLLWIITFVWVFLMGGARFIDENPRLFLAWGRPLIPSSLLMIRLLVATALLMAAMWLVEVPIPEIRWRLMPRSAE